MTFGMFFCVTAMGCADPVTPVGTWLERTDDHAIVRCNSTQELWYLTCTNGVWAGARHNCSVVTFEGDHLVSLLHICLQLLLMLVKQYKR
jgi:hypothetical protein